MNSLAILIAIFFGPVSALLASRALDRLRERRKARVELYHTVMANRATWLSFDSLRALNSIDVVFNRKKDEPVRDAWQKVISHVYTKRPEPSTEEGRAWDNRLEDLRADLYQKIGSAIGFNYDIDYIKTHRYYPQHHADAEVEWLQIRRLLLKLLSSEELAKRLNSLPEPSTEELLKGLSAGQAAAKKSDPS